MTIKEFLNLNKEVIEYRNCVALMDENRESVPDEVYAETCGTLAHLEESLMEAIELFSDAIDRVQAVASFDVRESPDGSGVKIESEL